MIGDVEFEIVGFGPYGEPEWTAVVGLQVGRFAVRSRLPGERLIARGRHRAAQAFIVNHIPSGVYFADFDTFDEALGFADDVSRFSENDPSADHPSKIVAQLGQRITEWVIATGSLRRYAPFRTWLAALEASVKSEA